MALVLLMLLFAPIFNISSIKVSGSSRYTPEKIEEASGIKLGDNGFRQLKLMPESIFELRLLDAEEKIKRLPYIKNAAVSIVIPNGVSIKVTEREPVAYIRYLDNYLTVDSEGFVFEAYNKRPEGEFKEIRGIEFAKYSLGRQLEDSDIEQIKSAIEILDAIKKSDSSTTLKLFEVLDWIDMVDKNNVQLSLDNRIVVRFNPEDKLQYTIDFTREIFFKKLNTKETGKLEFTGDQGPSFIPQ
jgi:cell division protein FtsQ